MMIHVNRSALMPGESGWMGHASQFLVNSLVLIDGRPWESSRVSKFKK